jgi:hypothetical protein
MKSYFDRMVVISQNLYIFESDQGGIARLTLICSIELDCTNAGFFPQEPGS